MEPLARARLPHAVGEYIGGGAADEHTLLENTSAFARRKLRPRVLTGVSRIDPSTTILGREVNVPVGIAPTGWLGVVHPDAELAVARAAGKAGVLMCLSTASNFTLEEVAEANTGAGGDARWFQLYANRNRDLVKDLLQRAGTAGYEAIVFTVDLPLDGYRERQFRHEIDIGPHTEPANFRSFAKGRPMTEFMEGFVDPTLTWDDLGWIGDAAGLPLIVKGILTAEDAVLAVEHGAAGIIVSNHGGRQLDRTAATIDVLEEVVDAVAGRAEVYIDGGVRRGTDVLISLALGARAVFVGRPIVWGLGAAGEAGVSRALRIFYDEVVNAMTLLGVRSVEEIVRTHVSPA